jgi:hypothetical protein
LAFRLQPGIFAIAWLLQIVYQGRLLISQNYYRFDSKTDDASILKGSTNSYFIRDRKMDLLGYCQVKGKCITHPTMFRSSPEAGTEWFRMEAKGKFLNMTYFLFEPDGPEPFATITQKGKGLWRVLDKAGQEHCRFVDCRSMGEKTAEALLGGSPDDYAITSGGDLVLARIRMEPRPDEESGVQEQGFLRRIFKNFTRKSDWIMALEPESAETDRRPLIAGMILLIEHTIAGHKSD